MAIRPAGIAYKTKAKGVAFLFLSMLIYKLIKAIIDHFTVSCLVAWPLNESEAGGDLVLIETSQLFSC